MTNRIVSRIVETPYPRLTLLILGGIAAFVAAGSLVVADPMLAGPYGPLTFRLFVLGYLLVLFGGAGYVSLLIAERVPES